MLPIRDSVHSYTFSVINWLIIALNTVVFLIEINLSPVALNRFIQIFALTPANLHLNDPTTLFSNPMLLIPLITHMFLHGGWFHFLSNMWILFIFGDNVEDRMGSIRYLIFYLAGGVVAGALQTFVSPFSEIPSLGASGAIATVLGAYFLLYPRARVTTLIPMIFVPWFVEIPAVIYLGFWFVSQLFSGIASLGAANAANMGGVAWFAHIGGFVFGLLFARIFIPRRHPAFLRQFPDEYYPW
ncbi:MAG: rhomboid family intramembrane serine protease [Chloroflexi bacterium]|nr:rhomboid family intramembrane serine protease [Chloroflexota bacterium]